jgi:excisionase family DNA binding protein
MNDLARGLLDLIRPDLERLVDERVEQGLRRFVPPDPEPWMSTERAARYLGMSVPALRARAQRGTIPAHKDETRWVFNREELDRALRR